MGGDGWGKKWVLMRMGGRGLDPAWHISGVGWEGGKKVCKPLGNKPSIFEISNFLHVVLHDTLSPLQKE